MKRNFFDSMKFIFSFMKKYSFFLIIVGILIIITTYLQVIAPKLMGNSIDEMTKLVGQTKFEQLEAKIDQGKGLTSDEKNTLIDVGDFDEEQKKTILKATPKELKTFYDKMQRLDKIFSKDNNNILSGKGLSTVQQKLVIKSEEFTDEEKGALLFVPPNIISQVYLSRQYGLTDVEKEAIEKSSIEELNEMYLQSQTRLDAIMLNPDMVDTKTSWNEEQIEYIKKQELPVEVENEVLNSSNIEIEQSYAARDQKISSKEQNITFMFSLVKLFISYILLAFFMFFYNYYMSIVSGKTTRDMRKGMFGKIESLSIRFFDQINAGDLLSRFTNDIDNISTALTQSIIQVISQAAMLFGIIIIMFKEDNTTATLNIFGSKIEVSNILVWSMFIFAFLAIFLAFFIIKKARYHVSRQQTKLGDLNGYIDERISGQKVIISYGLEDQTLKDFDEYNTELRNTSTKGQIYSGVLMPLMQGIGLVNLGFLVFLGSQYVIDGVITIGLLAAFIQYSQRFFNPLAQVVSQYNILELAAAGANRVEEVYVQEPEIINTPEAKDIDGIYGNVVLDQVDFGYDPNKLVLKNINLKVNKGQMVALVGPTGSGKTTVMNLMNRFYDVTNGEIRFDDIPIKDITISTLRKNVGIVLQESILFSGTIKYNIAYGNLDASEEEIIAAAKLANIHEFIMSLEDGYDTHVDNNTSMFSTGQKQLMSIARTIITDPDLLILDEATSNVDTVTEERIQKAMENVVKERTSFVIAHRLKTILDADVIIVLKDGQIIEQGSHKELLNQNGFYSELYHNQFVVE